MKNLLFISVLLFAIWGCRKGPVEYTLKGTITDDTFSTGLAGAHLSLYEIAAGNGDQTLIGETTLGADGTYSFTFERNKVESYRILVTKNNYFEIDQLVYQSTLTSKEDNIRDFSTTAKAWARVHLTTNNSAGHLQLLKTKGKNDCSECCAVGPFDFYGAIDTIFYCINDGNTIFEYQYSDLLNVQTGWININTVAFDTTNLNLTY